jgi:hypothetical protein
LTIWLSIEPVVELASQVSHGFGIAKKVVDDQKNVLIEVVPVNPELRIRREKF